MNERIERNEEGIDSLRNRMDADARFRRSLSGYDPQDVRAYVENVKRIFAQQAIAAKQEQEDLIAQLDSAQSEIQARNCGIKKLKDLLIDRESQLNAANIRINTLLQTVKAHVVERDELERLRQDALNKGDSERVLALEKETQQLRAAVAQASNLVNTWKAERERLMEENDRMREEVLYLRAVSSKPAAEYGTNRLYTGSAQFSSAYEQPMRPAQTDAYAPENRFASQAVQQPVQQTFQQPMQQPVQQTFQQPMQPTTQQLLASQQKEFSQVADKLATMFAEAYQLISQFKSGIDAQQEPQQRQTQPTMQILRPDAVNSDSYYTRK